jgi:ferredoxin
MSFFKVPTYRNQKWLRAVSELGTCVLCGSEGVQAAHANLGKGMGIKADDCLSAALCPTCHTNIDQGKDLSRDQRRSEMDRAIVLTLRELVLQGRVSVK